MSDLYADAAVTVREDLAAAHARSLASFSAPGTWFDGATRAGLAGEARQARAEAGLQPGTPPTEGGGAVPAAAARVVRRIAADPTDLDRSLFDDACAEGLSEEEYVECVGIAARISNLDMFARGLGVAPRPLPPVSAGEPSRRRPAAAVAEGAWVATIPNGEAGGAEGAALYGGQWAANILRALSLVPAEAADLIALGDVQYVSVANFMDFGYSHDPAISRQQVELVAARISALNACFY